MATRRSVPTPTSKAGQATTAKAPARRAKRSAAKGNSAAAKMTVTEETRRAMIAQAAYFHAERRGFAEGGEVEDWLNAEAEVDALLSGTAHGNRPQ